MGAAPSDWLGIFRCDGAAPACPDFWLTGDRALQHAAAD